MATGWARQHHVAYFAFSSILCFISPALAQNTLSVLPTSLGFSSQLAAPQSQQSQNISVSSTVSGLSFTSASATSSGGNWLSAYVTQTGTANGFTSATVRVTADVSAIPATGTYNGTVTLTSAGATNSPVTIPVTFTVTTGSVLTVSPTALSFVAAPGGSAPSAQYLTITSTASGLSYTAAVTAGASWLQVTNPSGITPANPNASPAVSVNPTGLAQGTYNGIITVSATGASNSPVTVPVTLVIGVNGISVAPTTLAFTYQSGGALPAAQKLAITSPGNGLAYTAAVTSGASWLQISSPSGTTPTTSNSSPVVSVNPVGLPNGTYNGTVVVTATGASNSPVSVPVTLTVSTNLLTVLPTSLSFSYPLGASAPPAQYLTLTSTSNGLTYTAAVTSGANWLQVSNPSGMTPANPNASPAASVVPNGLALGTYNGAITITATGAGNSPVTVPVTLTVVPNLLTVSPTSLNFSYQPGGIVPATQALTVTSTGSGLNYTASVTAGGTWLQLGSPSGATGSGTNPLVTVVPNGLAPGTYNGAVTVTAANAANSPVVVQVTLVVGNNLLTVSPTMLSFTYQAGGTAPPAQYLTITSTSNGLNYTASVTGGTSWLQVSNPTGVTPANPTGSPAVSVVPTGLAAGTYNGTITITATGALNSPVTVAVTLTVGTNLLTINPGSLSFSYQPGTTAPPAQNLVITSTGSGLNYTAAVTAGATWLQIANPNGTTAAASNSGPAVSVVPTGLAAGTYNGAITVTATGAGNSPVIVQVTLVVGTNPLSVTPTALSFNFALGASAPAAQCLTFATNSPGLAYTAAVTTGSAWLQISNGNGTTPSNVCAQVNAAGLAVGPYTGVITVTAAGASNSPIMIAVTLAVTNNVLTVLPTSLSFAAGVGGSAPPPQYLIITSTVSGLTYTAAVTQGASWLQVANPTGPTPATGNGGPAISVNPAGLAVGAYNGMITITAPGADGSPATIPVTLTVGNGNSLLNVTPASLSFSFSIGGTAPSAQYLTLVSPGAVLTYMASVTSGASWLQLSNPTGTTPANPNTSPAVSINTSGLTPGTYNGAVTITATGASNSPVTIPVTLTVSNNLLNVSQTSLNFNYQLGGSVPPAQLLTIGSTANGLLFTATVGAGTSWLQVTNATGTTPTNSSTSPAVSVVPTGLARGTYTGTVNISSSGAANSPVTITVTLVVGSNLVSISPTALNFSFQPGGTVPPAQNLTITSTSPGLSYSASVAAGASWLQVSSPSGVTATTPNASPGVSVVPTGLAPGTYNGAIIVTATGADNSPVSIPVTLVVGKANPLSITPSSLSFSFVTSATQAPPQQCLTVIGTPPGLAYAVSVSSGATWLKVSIGTGTTPSNVCVQVDPTGLAKGSYSGTITITAAGAGNTPISILVQFAVNDPTISCSTPSLSAGTAATAYQAALSCTGGLAPYKSWQLTSQPAGMAIDTSGKLTWPSPSCGVWNFTFSATDAGNQPSAQTSAQLVIKPASATVNNFPSTIQPIVNVNGVTLTLSSTCNQDITGTLALKFTPASGVTAASGGGSDGTISFSTGGASPLSVVFKIPALSVNATFNNTTSTTVNVQTGTVAGAFQLVPSLTGTVAPTTINGNLAGTDPVKDPVLTGITATRSGSTLTVAVTGYSSTRDLKQATFTFGGSGIQGASVIAPLGTASSSWFQNQASAATGGQFVYTQTFAVTGPASQVTSVSVAITNSASSGTGGVAGPANFTGN